MTIADIDESPFFTRNSKPRPMHSRSKNFTPKSVKKMLELIKNMSPHDMFVMPLELREAMNDPLISRAMKEKMKFFLCGSGKFPMLFQSMLGAVEHCIQETSKRIFFINPKIDTLVVEIWDGKSIFGRDTALIIKVGFMEGSEDILQLAARICGQQPAPVKAKMFVYFGIYADMEDNLSLVALVFRSSENVVNEVLHPVSGYSFGRVGLNTAATAVMAQLKIPSGIINAESVDECCFPGCSNGAYVLQVPSIVLSGAHSTEKCSASIDLFFVQQSVARCMSLIHKIRESWVAEEAVDVEEEGGKSYEDCEESSRQSVSWTMDSFSRFSQGNGKQKSGYGTYPPPPRSPDDQAVAAFAAMKVSELDDLHSCRQDMKHAWEERPSERQHIRFAQSPCPSPSEREEENVFADADADDADAVHPFCCYSEEHLD